jgi:predicted negative regulator of RcsB-dependent stress response
MKPRALRRLASWTACLPTGAYITAGKRELAIANYKKSLELNPANSNATQMLERLKAR